MKIGLFSLSPCVAGCGLCRHLLHPKGKKGQRPLHHNPHARWCGRGGEQPPPVCRPSREETGDVALARSHGRQALSLLIASNPSTVTPLRSRHSSGRLRVDAAGVIPGRRSRRRQNLSAYSHHRRTEDDAGHALRFPWSAVGARRSRLRGARDSARSLSAASAAPQRSSNFANHS